MNERIRAREVRVIDNEGNQLGIMQPFEALKIARERALDLVEISPNAQPPVCRIMDYGKFLYEEGKREKVAKKKQRNIVVKEVKFRINVDEHDYTTKKNHALRFLSEGDKVKATIFFRGREMTHRELGRRVLDRLIMELADKAIVESHARNEGNTMFAILAPPKAQVVRQKMSQQARDNQAEAEAAKKSATQAPVESEPAAAPEPVKQA